MDLTTLLPPERLSKSKAQAALQTALQQAKRVPPKDKKNNKTKRKNEEDGVASKPVRRRATQTASKGTFVFSPKASFLPTLEPNPEANFHPYAWSLPLLDPPDHPWNNTPVVECYQKHLAHYQQLSEHFKEAHLHKVIQELTVYTAAYPFHIPAVSRAASAIRLYPQHKDVSHVTQQSQQILAVVFIRLAALWDAFAPAQTKLHNLWTQQTERIDEYLKSEDCLTQYLRRLHGIFPPSNGAESTPQPSPTETAYNTPQTIHLPGPNAANQYSNTSGTNPSMPPGVTMNAPPVVDSQVNAPPSCSMTMPNINCGTTQTIHYYPTETAYQQQSGYLPTLLQ